jgi:hypothetical protein
VVQIYKPKTDRNVIYQNKIKRTVKDVITRKKSPCCSKPLWTEKDKTSDPS